MTDPDPYIDFDQPEAGDKWTRPNTQPPVRVWRDKERRRRHASGE